MKICGTKFRLMAWVTGAIVCSSTPILARTGAGATVPKNGSTFARFLECVPYARQLSGIRIFGDARTWWPQAAGRYTRGSRPAVGAVMAFKPYGKMRLGHVATVSRIVDERTVLLRHANWSPVNGRRGQIELDVRATDVSPNNSWSYVRVWFDPIGGLGSTAWPVQGFIYNRAVAGSEPVMQPAVRVAPHVLSSMPIQVRPQPMRGSVATLRWRLQLGAFAVSNNAERLWGKLRSRAELAGLPHQIVSTANIAKLQVGDFATVDLAWTACRRLEAAQIACIVIK